MKPIVTGLMAYGMSGRIFHAPFLTTNPHFQFKAVVERNQKKAAERYPDVISYNKIEDLINDPEIELIIVNTPSYTHFEYTKAALSAGKHVLLEKPAAATSAEVKELYDLSRSTGKHLMLYQNRRYDSGFQMVKQVIDSGRLGELVEVHFRYDRYRIAIGPKVFKEDNSYPANGLTYDLGPHLLDQTLALFGKPLSFKKTTATHRPNSKVDDYFHFHLTYPNNLNVFLTASLLVAEPLPAYVIHGTVGSFIKGQNDSQEAQLDKGMLPTDEGFGIEPAGSEGKLVIMGADNQKETELLPSYKGNYNGIFEAVYHTVRENALFPITEEQIAWQIEMLEA
ncbi:Gfo/Idh/MocA family oxidoreductase [Mucilaginibacter sp. RS28]|uniref:Gfo/Idh/MocA family oxidoreductase n=1 Tax=Mucilaginibacter straminoryzae TaxID=2932774 RepID=A0A9X2B771_9SPHI|nr:Gfo/Idh/MocA family oxidoreductase [Mucilaginibacter straminoryzae]MCJ8208214.1 Gfo/Idh/MocA family oxidoreductase [Mucilaginibacter straminoryzae]